MIEIRATGAQALADAVAALADNTTDHEAAGILAQARERLLTLSWNRYATSQSQASARRAVARRLRSHAGWKGMQS